MGTTAAPGVGNHGGDPLQDGDVVGDIADQIRQDGFFLTHVSPYPFQRVVDLRWAAQEAGGLLGRRVRAYASTAGALVPGMVTVIVAPLETWASDNPAMTHRIHRAVEELLDTPGSAVSGLRDAVSARRSPR
jgi:hypothetical protein